MMYRTKRSSTPVYEVVDRHPHDLQATKPEVKPSACKPEETGYCRSWKVIVGTEECLACSAGDSGAKVKIIERSVRRGIDRHREITTCRFRGDVLSTVKKPCCGNSRVSENVTILCELDDRPKDQDSCFSCPSFSPSLPDHDA